VKEREEDENWDAHYLLNPQTFSKKDNQALHEYTKASLVHNDYLWHKHNKTLNQSEYHPNLPSHHERFERDELKPLDNAIKRQTIPENMTLWSSTIHDPRVLKNSENIVHHPAYLSTSIHKYVAVNRDINSQEDAKGNVHHHILRIHVPKGTHGAYLANVSEYGKEHEVLLPRGQNLRYLKTSTILNHGKKQTHIHHMELLNE